MSSRKVVIDGVTYIRSRDAARAVNLALDYVSRLARHGAIAGGHVDDKLKLSLQHLKMLAASGRRVVIALPRDNAQGARQRLQATEGASIEVIALDRVHDLVNALGLTLPASAAASDDRRLIAGPKRSKFIYLGAGLGIACATAAVALAVTWDDRPIVLTLPKSHYVVGEPFAFTVRANRDCPFLVLTVDALGKPKLYDPAVEGAFMGDLVLKAREKRRIPVQGAAVVEPPAGTYQIAAVCDKADLARLGMGEGSPRKRRNFGFTVQDRVYIVDRDELDKIAVTYEVRER